MQEVLIARKLRLAFVATFWRDGSLSETEAKELLSGPLTPGDDSTIYDDARYLNDIDGLERDAQLRNEAEAGEQKSPSCSPTQHSWKKEYYGYKCERCQTFIPYGSEPWAPIDE